MSRVVPMSVLLAALALLALPGAGGASAGSPEAQAAGKCSIPGNGRQSGGIYFTSLSVKRTSCATGRAVEKAFQKCRKGPRGRCHHRVKHFKCTEHRSGISVQFDSSVNCKRGSKRVHFTYTQNT
jgi:hypothetical protein